MLVLLIYSASVFYVVLGTPSNPTSYVYRRDGPATKTYSSGKNREYRKVIVKEYELPLTVSSYSTYITHPVSSNEKNDHYDVKGYSFEENDWPKYTFDDHREYPMKNRNEDFNNYEEGKIDDYNKDEYWDNVVDNADDLENYISKLFHEEKTQHKRYVPYDDWLKKIHVSSAFDDEFYI